MQTLGQRLRQRREARNASIEAVTRATRLTRSVLVALEADRFEDLPPPVYIRGFLRLYSSYLEMEVDAVLEAYEQQVAVREVDTAATAVPHAAVTPHLPEYFRASTRSSRTLTPAQLFLLVATAAIVGVFTWSVNRSKRPVQLTVAPMTAPAQASLAAPDATATGPAAPRPPPIRAARRP